MRKVESVAQRLEGTARDQAATEPCSQATQPLEAKTLETELSGTFFGATTTASSTVQDPSKPESDGAVERSAVLRSAVERALVMRCLHKNPAQRFAHGGELLAALEHYREHALQGGEASAQSARMAD